MMLDNQPRGTICIEDLEIGMVRYLQKQITASERIVDEANAKTMAKPKRERPSRAEIGMTD